MSNKQTIGFVGIGMMGWPMAACLHGAGHDVLVFDSDRARVERFCEEVGGRDAASLRQVGEEAGMVITMLPSSAVVTAVLFGEADPLAPSLAPDSLVIDMTSGVPDETRNIATRLREGGIRIIDAPVSGGVPRAQRGELSIMTGGRPEDIEDALPVLQAMGTVMQVGELGAGQAMKVLNNLVSAGGFLIGIEALLIGKRFGLDPNTMVDVLNASTGMNNSTKNKFKQYVLSRGFDAGFSLGLMNKDISIALDMARASGVAVPFSALCREMWSAAGTALEGEKDHTAVALLSERLAGVSLEPSEN